MVPTRANGRVAVVIPVAHATLLSQSLDSVFLQSRPPDDVIVVAEDCSDIEQLRRAMMPYAGRVLWLREPGLGRGAARNAGIAVTDAEFVTVLRCGDRWAPHFLMSQMHVLRHDPTIDLSLTNGLHVGDSPMAGLFLFAPLDGTLTLDLLLRHGRAVPSSAVVARRAAVVAAGGFDPALRHGLDFDLWLRMAGSRLRFHAIVKALTLCRREAIVDGEVRLGELESAVDGVARLLDAPRWEAERPLIEQWVGMLRTAAEKERGKMWLERGDVRAARAAYSAACAGPHGWDVRAMQVGLRLAPWLVRRVYVAL